MLPQMRYHDRPQTHEPIATSPSLALHESPGSAFHQHPESSLRRRRGTTAA
jgi:hypothetical protein